MEKWLAMRTAGKTTSHFFSKLVPNAYQYPSPAMRTFSRNGVILTVDISDYIGHFYYFGFADSSLDQLFALCHERSFVLDIGTNVGFTALRLAQRASQGKVIGFEPDPFNYDSCKKNLELNRFNNLKVLNVALGASDDLLTMEIRTPSNRGGNRINVNAASAESYKVPVKKLDDLLPGLQIPKVDLMKIDVEGFEHNVLLGAESTLREFRPILFIEVDDQNLRDQRSSARALIEYLNKLGYHSIRRADTGEALDSSFNFNGCHFDVIAR